jgi:hypothetical protein
VSDHSSHPLVKDFNPIIHFHFTGNFARVHFCSVIEKHTNRQMNTLKNTLIFSILVMISYGTTAQIRFDLMTGVSPKSTPQNAGRLINRHLPHEEFVFNMIQAEPQVFGGVKAQMALASPFFIDAGLLYTKAKSTYHAAYTIIDAEHPQPDYFMHESRHMLLLPVNIGVNIGIIDVMSGFRLLHTLEKKSELSNLHEYVENTPASQLGWQGSIGVNIHRSRLGIEYQGNFSRVGAGMSMMGQSLELMNVPAQWVLLIQHSIF